MDEEAGAGEKVAVVGEMEEAEDWEVEGKEGEGEGWEEGVEGWEGEGCIIKCKHQISSSGLLKAAAKHLVNTIKHISESGLIKVTENKCNYAPWWRRTRRRWTWRWRRRWWGARRWGRGARRGRAAAHSTPEKCC